MSFQNASLPIQVFVNNYGNTGRTYEVIRAVQDVSAMNTAVRIDPNSFLVQPGKGRSVKLNYFPIVCDVEGECGDNVCEGGVVLEPRQQMFTIEKCISSKTYQIDIENVRMTDSREWDFTGIAENIVNSVMPALRQRIAEEWLTNLYAAAGVHRDGTQYGRRLNLVNPNTGIVNGAGLDPIYREFLDSGLQRPVIIGGGDIYAYQRNVERGGLNAAGQRVDLLDVNGIYYDNGLGGAILGTGNGDNVLAISPNVFKYVYYLRNAGIFATDGISGIRDFNRLMISGNESRIATTLVDPVSGIPFDLDIRMDDCGRKINFRLEHHYDFFFMPDVACNIQGLNGIMHYLTCPEVEVTCPSGSPIPSPAAPTIFSWSPGDIFPLTVGSISLGSVENQPNVQVTNIADLLDLLNDTMGSGMFAISGTSIYYAGYSALGGSLNNGQINITFA